jgi:hypothetical protein
VNNEQFQQAIAGTTEQRDVQARQVSNGFALVGNRRFLEPDTSAVRVSVTAEAVAVDADGAAAAASSFLRTGAFAS